MFHLVAVLAYLIFAAATVALIWAAEELARIDEPPGRQQSGVNPHALRF